MPKKEAGPPSARDARPLALSGEAGVLPIAVHGSADAVPQSSDAGDWLIAITKESNDRLTAIQKRQKPRIQKVPNLLRDREAGKNGALFQPAVVSLGPYHRHREDLAAMEENKKAAAARYAGGQHAPMGVFYDKARAVAGKARECYEDNFDWLSDEEFAKMMFFDGCFILHFIDCYLKEGSGSPTTSAHLQGFILRDIFLLENQVPFMVLEALMSLRTVKYKDFISKIIGGRVSSETQKEKTRKRWWSAKTKNQERGVEEGPLHLLDLLRTSLLRGEVPQNLRSIRPDWQSFRTVMELREAGIKFRKSETRCLRDVEFKKGFVHGLLEVPQIVVDDLTKSRFLNLIALEMCPDSNSDYGVTSYVCFLDNLIDHADDVKELRRKEILLNALGSDQQVADLFNELATGLSPEHYTYAKAVMGIKSHYKNEWKVSVARMLHTHFNSPWTTISFVAAVLLLVLTVLQTFFTIFSKFAINK